MPLLGDSAKILLDADCRRPAGVKFCGVVSQEYALTLQFATFGADDAKVAKDAGIPSLFVIDKAGDTRPMVDFTGKYFVQADMNEEFTSLCVRDSYWKHSGDFV